MRLLSVVLAFWAISVLGAGQPSNNLRHELERIYLYYGYLHDLNLPENQRLFGVKCKAYRPETKKCEGGEFVHCRGTATATVQGKQLKNVCSLREFLGHISGNRRTLKGSPEDTGNVRDYTGYRILGRGRDDLATADFDATQAAKNIQVADDKIRQEGGKAKFPYKIELPPYVMAKDNLNYFKNIKLLAEHARRIETTLPHKVPVNRNTPFEKLNDCGHLILEERLADNQIELIKRLGARYPIKYDSSPSGGKYIDNDRTRAAFEAKYGEQGAQAEFDKFKAEVHKYNQQEAPAKHIPPISSWQNAIDVLAPFEDCKSS